MDYHPYYFIQKAFCVFILWSHQELNQWYIFCFFALRFNLWLDIV